MKRTELNLGEVSRTDMNFSQVKGIELHWSAMDWSEANRTECFCEVELRPTFEHVQLGYIYKPWIIFPRSKQHLVGYECIVYFAYIYVLEN